MERIEGPETHALFREDGDILIEKEYVSKYKLRDDDIVYVRPRIKKAVKSALNSFLVRRPSRDDLLMANPNLLSTPQNSERPDVETVRKCVDYLISCEAYKLEGIFRISASHLNLKAFYETLRKKEPNFDIAETPHTVAAALKQYFRSLPAGLIPLSTAAPMRETFKQYEQSDELIPELAKLAKQLPKANLEVIDLVFGLVLRVIENVATTKMEAGNCAIVFAPNVFAFDTSMDLIEQSGIHSKLVQTFFTDYRAIFGAAL